MNAVSLKCLLLSTFKFGKPFILQWLWHETCQQARYRDLTSTVQCWPDMEYLQWTHPSISYSFLFVCLRWFTFQSCRDVFPYGTDLSSDGTVHCPRTPHRVSGEFEPATLALNSGTLPLSLIHSYWVVTLVRYQGVEHVICDVNVSTLWARPFWSLSPLRWYNFQ